MEKPSMVNSPPVSPVVEMPFLERGGISEALADGTDGTTDGTVRLRFDS